MHFSTTKFSPYIWIYSIPFYPKSISSSLKTMIALIPRPRIHFSIDSRSLHWVAKARPATCHGWCHSFYLRSPQMMFPSVLHISEAAGIDGILHPASWHTVIWVEKMWRIQSKPLSGSCNNRNNQHMNILAPQAPATLLTRPCQLHVVIAPSLSIPQCSLPWALLYKSHHQRCSLACMTFSSLSKVALSTQVGRFADTSDQQVFSRWRLYLAKWRIYLLIGPLVPL